MSLDLDPNHIFRDFVTDGIPASGKHDPKKVEIREHLSAMWQAVVALIADAHPGLTLPNLLIRYTVTGGTANAIEALPNLTPPSGPGLALFSMAIVEENTGPVTINGKPVRSSSGAAIGAGGLVGGGIYLFMDAGDSFRLLSDQASAGLVAAAEAAANRAEVEADRAAAYVATLSADRIKLPTVAALIADAVMSYEPGEDLIEVDAGDVVEAQGFRYEVAADDASDAHIETAGGVKLYVLPLGDRVYFAAFGLVGGDMDETNLLKRVFAAGVGYELRAGRAQTYRSSDGLQLMSGTDLNLRGSTINFNTVLNDRQRNLEIYGNNVTVKKGAIRKVSSVLGYEGSMQTPITVGRFQELIGFSGVVVEDMSIETMSLTGNGIILCGASHNIDIRRIRFPDSAYIGIPIMAHWSFNAAIVNVGGQRVTSHQKNIRINDIWCGNLSRLGDVGNCAAVMLSAVYSAEVNNITCENFSRGRAVYVYCGDWGFQFAQDANEQLLGSRGISVKNVYGRYFHGLEVYMRNTHGEPLVQWPLSVTFDNIHARGYGTASSSSWGYRVSGSNVGILNSSFDGFYDGGHPSTGSANFRFIDSEVKNSRRHGILASANIEDVASWQIRGSKFSDNNQGGFANVADIFLARVVDADVFSNTFDSPQCTWNVRAEGAANRPRFIKVRDNHTKRNPTSSNYSFGSQADTDIASVFEGNTYETVPAIFKGGQQVIGARNNISTAPLWIGERAIIPGGNAYIATGVSSTSDWRQITA